MTKEQFRQNIAEALGSPWSSVDSEKIDFLAELLYDPKENWTYNDFSELAQAIVREDGDVIYAVGEYDKCPDLTDPSNQELIVDWLREHPQAYRDVLIYVSKHKRKEE